MSRQQKIIHSTPVKLFTGVVLFAFALYWALAQAEAGVQQPDTNDLFSNPSAQVEMCSLPCEHPEGRFVSRKASINEVTGQARVEQLNVFVERLYPAVSSPEYFNPSPTPSGYVLKLEHFQVEHSKDDSAAIELDYAMLIGRLQNLNKALEPAESSVAKCEKKSSKSATDEQKTVQPRNISTGA